MTDVEYSSNNAGLEARPSETETFTTWASQKTFQLMSQTNRIWEKVRELESNVLDIVDRLEKLESKKS